MAAPDMEMVDAGNTCCRRRKGLLLFPVVLLGLMFVVLFSLSEEGISMLRIRTVDVVKTKVTDTESLQTPELVKRRNITLIVRLRGELGNQLSTLANARITQIIAQKQYPHIEIQLIGQHQDHPKWTHGRDDLVKCFSDAFHDFDFNGGIHDESGEFRIVEKLQNSWLNNDKLKQLDNVRSFRFLNSLLQQQEQNISGIPLLPSNVTKYSLPYLTATSFSWRDCIANEWYYNEMREWLSFNMNECCNPNIRPNDTDIIYHYRNFGVNVKGKMQPQFIEISPYVIANVAFQNYTRRDRVAITSRYSAGSDSYINAFRKRGISSYFVTGQQSGTEGFCFIMQAKHVTFGHYTSTYYRWATLLGNATWNRFYQIDASPVKPATVATMTPDQNGSFVNDTSPLDLTTSALRSVETIVRGNRTITIEVYRQPL